MKWQSVKFDWNHARAFLAIAEEGSLSAAARALGMVQPTLGRQLAALEAELGVPLFMRHGRGLELTPSGRQLLAHVQAMGEAAHALSLAAAGRNDSLEGRVTISASEVMATYVLPGMLAKLNHTLPQLSVQLISSNATTNLTRREADIAVRLFKPTQSDHICKRVGQISGNLYATPGYLASLGAPRCPADFAGAAFIGSHSDNTGYIELLRECGFPVSEDNFRHCSESRVTQWEMAKAGLGLAVMQEDVGHDEPSVVPVLPRIERMSGQLWLVTHQELRTSSRIRAVFDFLATEIAARNDAS
ncbi:LysR family transcriptional regulator [Ideonella sp.]|uniref:LysR family transcriptional regulator n=1 Tax=Ideonella sp. TaxID=1929293 RepID=UPI0035B3AA9B